MRFVVTDDALEVWNDGIFERCSDVTSAECEWLGSRKHRRDFRSFRKMASGEKRNRPGTTAAFGGLTAVYQFTDRPELFSNGEHWIVDEMAAERDRIQRARSPVEVDGTTFRLPWAVEGSAFRDRVRQEPLTRAAIDAFIDELRAAIPAAIPFLKNLRTIEAVSGSQHVNFERSFNAGNVRCRQRRPVLRVVGAVGSFAQEAAKLKETHPSVIEDARSPDVRVAVPVCGDAPAGLLYATLPTEELAHLAVLVHADFVPASDRKGIRFDTSPVSEWKRATIRAAAALLGATSRWSRRRSGTRRSSTCSSRRAACTRDSNSNASTRRSERSGRRSRERSRALASSRSRREGTAPSLRSPLGRGLGARRRSTSASTLSTLGYGPTGSDYEATRRFAFSALATSPSHSDPAA